MAKGKKERKTAGRAGKRADEDPGRDEGAEDEVSPDAFEQSLVDRVMLLIIRGAAGVKLKAACAQLGMTEEGEADAAIAQARQRIMAAADAGHNEQVALSILRLNDLYLKCADAKDIDDCNYAVALGAQRELNKLLRLYKDDPSEGEGGDLAAQQAVAMAHLLPLGLSRKPDPTLVELCRLAAARIMRLEERRSR